MYSWGGVFCNCCNHKVKKFLPYGVEADIYKNHHIIGGGRRAAQCPICGSLDRWRWFLYVMQNYTTVFKTECSVLHFAPEAEVSTYFRKCDRIVYFTADKDKNSADCTIDMTDIPFRNEEFDYIIANHVLSYIEDEEKAIYELKRCLKKKGKIVLSFPICTDTDTYEDYKAKETDVDMMLFGTKDNVRMYGKDYKQRLEAYGLKITVYSPKWLLKEEEIVHLGLIKDDVVLLCEKV